MGGRGGGRERGGEHREGGKHNKEVHSQQKPPQMREASFRFHDLESVYLIGVNVGNVNYISI